MKYVYLLNRYKPVKVYYPMVQDRSEFLSNGTVEEIVHRILEEKQHLAYSIIVPSKKMELEKEVLEAFEK